VAGMRAPERTGYGGWRTGRPWFRRCSFWRSSCLPGWPCATSTAPMWTACPVSSRSSSNTQRTPDPRQGRHRPVPTRQQRRTTQPRQCHRSCPHSVAYRGTVLRRCSVAVRMARSSDAVVCCTSQRSADSPRLQ
jgi:hypothetical protein